MDMFGMQIGRYRTFLSHSSCIWDVTILPTTSTQLPQAAAAALQPTTNEEDSLCSRGDFATCSADGSIRIWNLGLCQEVTAPGSNTSPSPCAHPSNIYSKDILGVLYIGLYNIQEILQKSFNFRFFTVFLQNPL
jgi:WD40 repeat protein